MEEGENAYLSENISRSIGDDGNSRGDVDVSSRSTNLTSSERSLKPKNVRLRTVTLLRKYDRRKSGDSTHLSNGIGSGISDDGDGRCDVDVSTSSTDLTNSNCWCEVRVSTVEGARRHSNGRSRSAYLSFSGGDLREDGGGEESVGDRSGFSLLVEDVRREGWDLGSGESDDDGGDESREGDDVDHFERE